VVIPDHVHLVLTPLISKEKAAVVTLAEIMSGIKGTPSHLINRRLKRHGRVWQEESFDRVLRSSEKLDEKSDYILNNPVRKGLVARAEDYPWLWPAPGKIRSPAELGPTLP
jgi:REP element-mobilizing transposase RayT